LWIEQTCENVLGCVREPSVQSPESNLDSFAVIFLEFVPRGIVR
jgi:hypothetical protein